MEDIRFVLYAANSERAVVMGFSEGGPACALLAASAPDRVVSLILYGSFANGPRDNSDPRLVERWQVARDKLDDVVAHWGTGRTIDLFCAQRCESLSAANCRRLRASGGESGDGRGGYRGCGTHRRTQRPAEHPRTGARSSPRGRLDANRGRSGARRVDSERPLR